MSWSGNQWKLPVGKHSVGLLITRTMTLGGFLAVTGSDNSGVDINDAARSLKMNPSYYFEVIKQLLYDYVTYKLLTLRIQVVLSLSNSCEIMNIK